MTKETPHPAHSEFIALAGELAKTFSFNRSIGQLYGFLFLCKEPLSLEDIAKCCHMSKGNASLQLRTLEDWGAVHHSSKPGTRKDFYMANTDLAALALRRLQEGLSKRVLMARHRIKLIQENPAFTALLKDSKTAHCATRIQDIESLLNQIESGLAWLPKLAQLKKILHP
jgi:DNA-binding transcriptional regulator GbsR (MarR family)